MNRDYHVLNGRGVVVFTTNDKTLAKLFVERMAKLGARFHIETVRKAA